MRKSNLPRHQQPWWLSLGVIRGFEGEEGGTGTESTEGGSGTAEGDSQGVGDDGVEGEQGLTPKYTDDDVSGLKSALQKERNERQKELKELKALRKAQQGREDAEKTDIERLTQAQERATEKIQKLANTLLNQAVESAILKAAQDAKFMDPTDALRPEILSAVTVTQDEDDPADITVDGDSVTAAVKALAKQKPHYLGGTTTSAPSASKFGGAGGRGNTSTTEQKLAALYPALQNR